MNDSTLRKMRLSLAAAALFVALLGAVALGNIRRFANAEEWHTHTYEVLIENNFMNRAVRDLDINRREYALRGKAEDLAKMHESEALFRTHFDRMVALTTDRREQQLRLQVLRNLEARWIAVSVKPIEELRAPSSNGLLSLASLMDTTARGAPLLNRVRQMLRTIEDDERHLLEHRAQAQEHSRHISMWTLAIGAGTLTLLFCVLATELLRRVGEVVKANTILKNEIAQREIMQQEILENQLLFHTFMDHNPAVAFIKDANGRLTYVNQPLREKFGAQAKDLLGKTDDQWLPVNVAQQTMENDRAIIEAGQARELTEVMPTPDGVERQWLVFKFPFVNRNNEHFLGGLAVDITERKRIEDDLKGSQANLTALIENTNDVIWSVDRSYRVITFNSAFEESVLRRHGVPAQLGQTLIDVVPEPTRTHWKNLYERAFAGEHFSVEQSQEINGQITDSEVVFNPIVTDDEITGATVFSRDITERKKIERLKNEFISTVSHELRTPLTSIRGALGLLAGGVTGELPQTARPLVEIAVSNSDRLVRLINDILDTEKIESGKLDLHLHPVQIAPLVRESLEANREYAATFGVDFALESHANDAFVLADADRLTQVLTNLLSNAAKFSPRNGRVQVQIEKTENQNAVRVSVRDEGAGVPAEFRERIFQKFAQADSSDTRQKGGTGLGLSISKALVEKLGGHIGFDSEPGNGATFFFELPLHRESIRPLSYVAGHPEFGRTFDKDSPYVLICEADAEVASQLQLIIENIGFQAEVAGTVAEAMQKLRARRYAALTLDLMLPDGDGISLIRHLRAYAETRSLPVIVVSAAAATRRGGLSGDAVNIVDWLEKPVDTTRLLATVRQVVTCGDETAPRILHVEDDPDVVHIVATILNGCGKLDNAKTLHEAKDRLTAQDYKLVILDVGLPDGSGLDLLPALRQGSKPVPVVIFSARDLTSEDVQATEAVLVKSRTSNQQLRDTIQKFLEPEMLATKPDEEIA